MFGKGDVTHPKHNFSAFRVPVLYMQLLRLNVDFCPVV